MTTQCSEENTTPTATCNLQLLVTPDLVGLRARNGPDDLINEQHRSCGILNEHNFTQMYQPVETNTYLTLDTEEAANITSDCNLPYGQCQIFKGTLETINQALVDIKWTDPCEIENHYKLLKLPGEWSQLPEHQFLPLDYLFPKDLDP